MQSKIDTLKTACESLRTAREALDNLGKTEAELKAARKTLQAQLDNAPVESLAVPSGDDKAFDRPISRVLSARNDIDIKLDLLPGIRVRYQAQAEGLSQRIRVAVKALVHHCRDAAESKLETDEAAFAAYLLPHCGGDSDRAKVQAARAMHASNLWEVATTPTQGCDAWQWRETFAHYPHAHDPLENAETIIDLAERFTRNEACP
jgi:hypothetical protein